MSTRRPIDLQKWIDENRHLLKPPVGNKQIWMDVGNFIVMVVGGPNARKDYHYNETEELYFQIEGDVEVGIQEDGKAVTIPIKEGQMFLLPGKVPHQPRRGPDTVGLVIEKKRDDGEKDGLQWYCEKCNNKLYEEYFQLENIMTQFQGIFERFYSNKENRTCDKCGTVMEPPEKK
ncbi:MAG: 3-hydroxyanthranilate 3,4-dioxygenase [Bacteroidia bacterium]